MIYLLLKTLHIVAVMTWIGGIVLQAFLLRTVARQPLPLLPDERSVIGAAVRWDRRVTVPAMLIAWTCGLALVVQGHWWAATWLSLKLALVIALSGVHGMQAGSLRRLVDNPVRLPPAWLRYAATMVVCGVTAIVFLVVAKPG